VSSSQCAIDEVSRGRFEIVVGQANICELLGMAWSNPYGSISCRVLKLGGKAREEFIPNSVTNLVVRPYERVNPIPKIGPVSIGSCPCQIRK
jgi:hypothetical protein